MHRRTYGRRGAGAPDFGAIPSAECRNGRLSLPIVRSRSCGRHRNLAADDLLARFGRTRRRHRQGEGPWTSKTCRAGAWLSLHPHLSLAPRRSGLGGRQARGYSRSCARYIADQSRPRVPYRAQSRSPCDLALGAHSPERFAALAPVAGTGDTQTACQLVDTPVWALHGDRDDVVPPEGSFAMARAIRNCGGQISRLTIYPDLGHNAWDPAYEDPALYLWLLSQRRARKKE
ncbi:MAG: prolyl oligopeptidase family serine peptidase [Erythrobacter sp.]|nr:prolyl oligopeptidase family serine peptidase [Erythrobacter sp.]